MLKSFVLFITSEIVGDHKMYAINHIKLAAHTSKQSILYEISYTKRDLSPDSEMYRKIIYILCMCTFTLKLSTINRQPHLYNPHF